MSITIFTATGKMGHSSTTMRIPLANMWDVIHGAEADAALSEGSDRLNRFIKHCMMYGIPIDPQLLPNVDMVFSVVPMPDFRAGRQ